MSDQNIFGDNQNNSSTQTPPSSQTDQLTTLLASIKNESGEQKYKSVDEALKALAHSQEYIPQLKRELQKTQEEKERAQADAARIAELERTLESLAQNSNKNPGTDQSTGLNEESVTELISKTLNKFESQKTQQQNQQIVANALKKLHGENAEKVFYEKAAELGFTKDEINSLAGKTPQAVLKLFVPETSSQQSGFGSSGINTTGFSPKVDSLIKANDKSVMLGASTDQLVQESKNARRMVEELEAAGMSTADLANPKMFKKIFG